MTKTNNEFMQNILKEEAWKKLSKDFEWSETVECNGQRAEKYAY